MKILVADDEASILSTMSRALSREGHVVVTAMDGTDAIQSLMLDPDGFDLVISDIRMGDISGIQLYEWIQRELPRLANRFLFHSGTLWDLSGNNLEQVPTLDKPSNLKELRSKIQTVLGVL